MTPFRFRTSLLALALAPTWGAALAKSDAEPKLTIEERIVVSANRNETAAHLVGSSVTVIDEAEIEARGAVTVPELLRTVPGLEVTQTGGPGGATSVFVRGANSNATLVLIDGLRVNTPTGGGFDFADITSDNVARIEVLRGPQSALYGAEAIGGVISIFTRRGTAEGISGGVSAEGGTDDFGRLRASLRGGAASVDYSVSASRQENNGFSQASERAGNREADHWENTTASAAVGIDLADDGRFDVSVRTLEADTGLDGFDFLVGPVDDPDASQERSALFATAELGKDLGSRARLNVRLGVADDEIEGLDPTTSSNNFLIDSQVSEADVKVDLSLADSDTLTFGATYQDQEGSSRGAFASSTDLTSFYVQNQWVSGDDLSIVLGVRSDDHSTFGSETTYRGAVSYNFPSESRLHASVGTGFKAPSYFDLFFPGFGNSGLQAETSTGFDVGFEQAFAGGRAVLDVTYFDNQYDDLISFNAAFMAVNIAEASANGIEAAFGWIFSEKLQWSLNHTWTDAQNDVTGAPLARRPEHRTTSSLTFDPASPWRGSVTAIAVRDRVDSDGSVMDDYERVDVNASYALTGNLRVGARLINLLDQSYEEVNGFTTPGFQGVLTVAYGF